MGEVREVVNDVGGVGFGGDCGGGCCTTSDRTSWKQDNETTKKGKEER